MLIMVFFQCPKERTKSAHASIAKKFLWNITVYQNQPWANMKNSKRETYFFVLKYYFNTT